MWSTYKKVLLLGLVALVMSLDQNYESIPQFAPQVFNHSTSTSYCQFKCTGEGFKECWNECINEHAKFFILQQNMEKVEKNFRFSKGVDSEFPILYFLGSTGSGKSTLINYLLGVKLEISEDDYDDEIRLSQVVGEGKTGPAIGNDGVSCTKIPEAYFDDNSNVVYVDPAGFGDTEGVEQEIANAYSYERMFQRGSKMKLAIVVSKSELQSQRGGPLIGILQRVFAMFPHDIESIQDTTSIVITKGKLRDSMEDQLVDWNYLDRLKKVQQKLAKKVISIVSKYDSVYQKQGIRFVKHLAETNRIIILPHASQINPTIITQVQGSLLKLPSRTLQIDVLISLGNKAQLFLNEYKDTLIEDFEEVKKHIITKIDETYNFEECEDQQKIFNALSELNEVITVFKQIALIRTQQNFQNQLNHLFKILHLNQPLILQIITIFDKVNFCHKVYNQIDLSNLEFQQIISHLLVKKQHTARKLQKIVSDQESKKLQEEFEKKNVELQHKFEEDLERERKQLEETERRIRQNLENENREIRAIIQQQQQQLQQQQLLHQQQQQQLQQQRHQQLQQQQQLYQQQLQQKQQQLRQQQQRFQQQLQQKQRQMQQQQQRHQQQMRKKKKKWYQKIF